MLRLAFFSSLYIYHSANGKQENTNKTNMTRKIANHINCKQKKKEEEEISAALWFSLVCSHLHAPLTEEKKISLFTTDLGCIYMLFVCVCVFVCDWWMVNIRINNFLFSTDFLFCYATVCTFTISFDPPLVFFIICCFLVNFFFSLVFLFLICIHLLGRWQIREYFW